MKVSFYTLGCKVNQYETEAMKEQFSSRGFEVVPDETFADAYIINTCTVTNLADRKSRQFIRRMKKLSPDSVIAVTGCYSQVKSEEIEAMPEVDIVTGNGEKRILLELVETVLANRNLNRDGEGFRRSDIAAKQGADFINNIDADEVAATEKRQGKAIVRVMPYESLTDYTDEGIIMSMDGRTRAYIKIEEGCDRFCSYCLIPFARGHVRSRNPLEIIEEAKMLIDRGFRELVLTGINTALYGTEDGFREKFPDIFVGENSELSGMEIIIKSISELEGDFRIRLSSLEPTVVNAEYVGRLIKYERLCPHLHLSIQSGSDKIIGLMNRRYTRKDYMDIVDTLRKHDSGYGITTDVIVGFPCEEQDDFEASLDIMDKVKFAKVHVFKYSKRSGTRAAGMKNQVSGAEKNLRSSSLIAAAEQAAAEFFLSEVGKLRTVLFEESLNEAVTEALNEGIAKKSFDFEAEKNVGGNGSNNTAHPKENDLRCFESEGNIISGYTENYIRVYATVPAGQDKSDYINKLIKVRLTGLKEDGMTAEII